MGLRRSTRERQRTPTLAGSADSARSPKDSESTYDRPMDSEEPLELKTDRLILRSFVSSDADAVFEYASDVETTQHMGWDTLREPHEAQEWVDGVVKGTSEFAFAITVTPESPVIGAVGVDWNTEKNRVMELGYILHRQHWGNGYMPEAGRALMRYAFGKFSVERIYAPIYADNAKSRRAAEKMGMKLDGILRSAKLVRGRRRDECIYSILRGEV